MMGKTTFSTKHVIRACMVTLSKNDRQAKLSDGRPALWDGCSGTLEHRICPLTAERSSALLGSSSAATIKHRSKLSDYIGLKLGLEF